jgi:hypothetical protein
MIRQELLFNFVNAENTKTLFFFNAPYIRKSMALFEGFKNSPSSPSDKSVMKMNMNIRHWWKILKKETRNNPTLKKLFLYHFVLH